MCFIYFFLCFVRTFERQQTFPRAQSVTFHLICSRGIKGCPLQENTDLTAQMQNAKPYHMLFPSTVYSQRFRSTAGESI